MNQGEKLTIVAVSGGFDPLHQGHIRMFKEAKSLGDELVVILNNDNWVQKKKGYIFMGEQGRKEVIEAIKYVDRVIITRHPQNTDDMSVVHMLRELKPDIFANGGDRDQRDANKFTSSLNLEHQLCKKIGIKMVFNIGHGGKIQSSSSLVDKAIKTAPRKVQVIIKGVKESKGRKG